jgi:hypothetical protein
VRHRSRRWAAVLSMASLLTFAPSAHASATVDRFFGTQTQTFTAPLEGCLPDDLVGTVTVTETSSGQLVETPAGFIVHGLNEYDYRAVFPDGRYVESGLDRDLYVFVTHGPHGVYNLVSQDARTIFAADGTPVGTLAIHAGSHITWNDRNGDGILDPGDISATLDSFRLRCG